MFVYYLILFLLLYLGLIKFLGKKYKNLENIILIIAAFILFFFAAMRSINVGADTRQYCSHFLELSQTKWVDLGSYNNGWYGDIEIGYKIYNKLLSVFENQQTITIVNSLLLIGFIFLVIKKQSKNKWLSIFLYFTFGFYQTALNFTPSSIVSYFLFLSFPFIKEKRLLRFLIFVGIGSLFHTSAIFFIPLYFLSKLNMNRKTFGWVLTFSTIIFSFYQQFVKVISLFLPQKYKWYIDSTILHRGNTIELVVLLVQIIAIIFCLFQFKRQNRIKLRESNHIISWLLVYEVILYLLSTKAVMFSRGAFLFSPYTIIIIPNIISEIKDRKRKSFATIGIILYAVTLYIIRTNINNIGKTIPYEFFFDIVQ